jgi:cytochrome d ubiquinol oxidase subunit II
MWQLTAGRGPAAERLRDHAHHALAPVWEANHVWLLFAVTVSWTAYPRVFASVFSTLCAPLFLAAVGIIMRGAAYALRSGSPDRRAIDVLFAASSILTPFGLGAAVGGIASGRVPVGNAAGDLIDSWVNPTSIAVGTLAVAVSAYLAAVYLAADAARREAPGLAESFRARGIVSGVVAGALALASLAAMRSDAPRLYDRLAGGSGLAAVLVSAVAGVLALVMLVRRHNERARVAAALAVAAMIAGWGLAQRPDLLPGLTVAGAAAGRPVLWALLISAVIGAVILIPSLAYLYGLVLRGRFDEASEGGEQTSPVPPTLVGGRAAAPRTAMALMPIGALGLFLAQNGALQAVSVLLLLVGAGVAFVRVATGTAA